MEEREIKKGDVFEHFKAELDNDRQKHLYEVLEIAEHTETKEKLVIYRALYNSRVFARPYEMFISEVDKDKYPMIKRKYRMTDISSEYYANLYGVGGTVVMSSENLRLAVAILIFLIVVILTYGV